MIAKRALAGALVGLLMLATAGVAWAGDYPGTGDDNDDSNSGDSDTCRTAKATLLDARVKLASSLLDDDGLLDNLLDDTLGLGDLLETGDDAILDLRAALRLATEEYDEAC